MNPYKRILRLEKRIKNLETENMNLRHINENANKIQSECEIKIRLANEKENKYNKLIIELQQEQQKYKKLIHKMKFMISKIGNTYKNAFDNVKKDFEN